MVSLNPNLLIVLFCLVLGCGEKEQSNTDDTDDTDIGDTDDTDTDTDPVDPNSTDDDGDGYSEDDGDCDDDDSSLNLHDLDGDGYTTCDGDCNQYKSDTFPGAAETEDATACMTDSDDDGWGDDDPLPLVTAGTDCDDDDDAVSPEASESCSGGVDEDCDGLLDCEDGDCSDDEACVEICDDETDNDVDGYTDCDDDDCWGDISCKQVRTTLSGGNAWFRTVNTYFETGDRGTIEVASAYGSIEVGTGSSIATCAWSFDAARFSGGYSAPPSGFLMSLTTDRDNFLIDSGCGTSGSAFLPTFGVLYHHKLIAFTSGTTFPWYQGTTTITGSIDGGSMSTHWRIRQLSEQSFVKN